MGPHFDRTSTYEEALCTFVVIINDENGFWKKKKNLLCSNDFKLQHTRFLWSRCSTCRCLCPTWSMMMTIS